MLFECLIVLAQDHMHNVKNLNVLAKKNPHLSWDNNSRKEVIPITKADNGGPLYLVHNVDNLR